MKKVLLSAVITMCSVISLNAQSFAKNDNVAGVNVGLGGSYGIPISLSYERGVHDINKDMSIGVGGLIGYGSSSEDFVGGEWSYSNILIGARGSYHYTGINKLDLFAGLTLGYDIVSAKWKGDGISVDGAEASGILWGLHAGARYYFNEKFGVNAELGYGLSYLSIGLSYKF